MNVRLVNPALPWLSFCVNCFESENYVSDEIVERFLKNCRVRYFYDVVPIL